MVGLLKSLLQWATAQYNINGEESESSDENIWTTILDWLNSQMGVLIAPSATILVIALVVSILVCCFAKNKNMREDREIRKIPLVVIVGTVLAVLASTAAFWYYSAELLKSVAVADNSTSNQTTSQSGSVHDTMENVVDKSILFLDNSIRSVNTTVLTLCWEALPKLQDLLKDMGNQLLVALASDSRLKPLFDLLDLFLATVHRIVNEMESISQARSNALDQLAQMKGSVNGLQSNVNRTLHSVCASARFAASASECSALKEYLALVKVGPDAARIDTDLSVSVRTLQRLYNLNITHLDIQVVQAKATLNNMIGSVDKLVETLLTQLIGTASREFQRWLIEINKLGDTMSTVVSGSDSKVYVIYVVLCVLFVVALSVLVFVFMIASWSCIIVLLRNNSTSTNKVLKRCTFVALMIVLILASILLTLGCLWLTVGKVAEGEVVAPMTTESGRRDLDNSLDDFVRDAGWPRLRLFLESITDIPLPFNFSKELPTGILQNMLNRCGPPNRETLPQILDLLDTVDSSRFVKSDLVSQELSRLRQSLISGLQNQSSESLISKQYVDDLVSQLDPFVRIVDSADYSGSISELSNPLLGLNDTQLLWMIGELQDLSQIVKRSNATDPRGFELRIWADQLQSVRSERAPAVVAGLMQLRDRFISLQNSRVLGNLTGQLLLQIDDFRLGFDRLRRNLSLMEYRFNQSVDDARPKAIELLDGLLRSALTSVGHCDGLLPVFEDVSSFSGNFVSIVWLWGLCLLISSAFVIIGYSVYCAFFFGLLKNTSSSQYEMSVLSR